MTQWTVAHQAPLSMEFGHHVTDNTLQPILSVGFSLPESTILPSQHHSPTAPPSCSLSSPSLSSAWMAGKSSDYLVLFFLASHFSSTRHSLLPNPCDSAEGVTSLFWCCYLVTKSCLTLCDPMTVEPTRLLCPWDFPARILEWVAISSSGGSS